MPDILHVIPAQGRQVRAPRTKKPIPAQGVEVERSSYWLRRIKDGDVVESSTAKKPAVKKSAAKSGGEE